MSHLNFSTALQNWTIFGIFNDLLSTQIVNVASFALNGECDFFWQFSNTVNQCHSFVCHSIALSPMHLMIFFLLFRFSQIFPYYITLGAMLYLVPIGCYHFMSKVNLTNLVKTLNAQVIISIQIISLKSLHKTDPTDFQKNCIT